MMTNMKIYIDTCCYCRPFDAARQSQRRVDVEAVVIENVVDLCKTAAFAVIGSPAVETEIKKIRDDVKRGNVLSFYNTAVSDEVYFTANVLDRARVLTESGIGKFDAYHVALAEAAGADYLLTADIRLEEAASALNLTVKVVNPLTFLPEVMQWAQSLM